MDDNLGSKDPYNSMNTAKDEIEPDFLKKKEGSGGGAAAAVGDIAGAVMAAKGGGGAAAAKGGSAAGGAAAKGAAAGEADRFYFSVKVFIALKHKLALMILC